MPFALDKEYPIKLFIEGFEDDPSETWVYDKMGDDLYSWVNELLGLKLDFYERTKDPDLFNWYCNLRDNLCLKIQEQRVRVSFKFIVK
tara:strand:+ start:671 stop:934 length:264 start_codon:yes stop_codon:yes gene_type:complete